MQATTQAPVLCICQQMPELCPVGRANNVAACYAPRGVGNFMIMGRKVCILTVAHLFEREPAEYLLVEKTAERVQAMFPFRYAIPQESTLDAACIPVGELDPATQQMIIQPTSSFQGSYHIHM